jgi:hypothetical protein
MAENTPDPESLRLRALLTAAFTEAQANAGEPLSPWKPEGFAVIAAAALVGVVVLRDDLQQIGVAQPDEDTWGAIHQPEDAMFVHGARCDSDPPCVPVFTLEAE